MIYETEHQALKRPELILLAFGNNNTWMNCVKCIGFGIAKKNHNLDFVQPAQYFNFIKRMNIEILKQYIETEPSYRIE